MKGRRSRKQIIYLSSQSQKSLVYVAIWWLTTVLFLWLSDCYCDCNSETFRGRRHTFISGCWFPLRAQAIWRQRIESLALGIPFIELKQFGRHVPVGVYHVYKHHVAVPEALLLQGGILLSQPGGMVLHPGWASLQESRQAVSIWCTGGGGWAEGGSWWGEWGGKKMEKFRGMVRWVFVQNEILKNKLTFYSRMVWTN